MVISSRNSIWHFSKYFVIFNSPTKILCVIYFCSKSIPIHSCTEPIYTVRAYSLIGLTLKLLFLGDCLSYHFMIMRHCWPTVNILSEFWFQECVALQLTQNHGFHFSVTRTQESEKWTFHLQKCFESDLSPMSAMPPGPVFQSLPLYSSPSCVVYISDVLWTKLKAVGCLRGFLCCF